MNTIVLPLSDRRLRRRERVEVLEQGIAAVVLVSSGVTRLRADAAMDRSFAMVQLVTAALLVAAVLRELRGTAETPARVGWLDLAAGLVFLVEWSYSLAHGGRLVRVSLLMAVLSLAQGIFRAQFDQWKEGRRRLRLGPEGIDYRLTPFHRFRLRWPEVASLTLTPADARFRTHGGRAHRVQLRRLENGAEIARALEEHARAAGVAVQRTAEPGTPRLDPDAP